MVVQVENLALFLKIAAHFEGGCQPNRREVDQIRGFYPLYLPLLRNDAAHNGCHDHPAGANVGAKIGESFSDLFQSIIGENQNALYTSRDTLPFALHLLYGAFPSDRPRHIIIDPLAAFTFYSDLFIIVSGD